MADGDHDVASWSKEQVASWLEKKGLGDYAEVFQRHKIDGSVLLMMKESDLRQPPLEINILGDMKKLVNYIGELQHRAQSDNHVCHLHNTVDRTSLSTCSTPRHNLYRVSANENVSDDDTDELIEEEVERIVNRSGRYAQNVEPEIFKTVLSFVYMFFVFLLTSFIMTVVHDRVPDPKKYPPLPDLFLDNMPYVPWAFQVCEMIGVTMFCIWALLLFFHKYRFTLMRRMFSMLGTIFLLRCVSMLITSLSVPGIHLQCDQKFETWYAKLTRTYEIWSGMGMTIHGVNSCGDYMFNTPRRMLQLHTFTWVCNLFAIFFLLAAHEHYSIDVFIAFYITSRLFLYYHTLANNRSLMARDKQRRKAWFPLFSYFESKCDGIVPNVYEWPFPYPKSLVNYFEKKQKKH
ncbi:SAMD8-like protein [Mya arenaria]|uniref:SAMD8-like protein n=1 Tax=Mya arenaria TaxID=6604 RepID=A0ABY7DI71_MYAAR|nr:SAMD8-like protein [Mya arenaria]WAQ97014.1 SAMD8-like protein [Mya arenaria]